LRAFKVTRKKQDFLNGKNRLELRKNRAMYENFLIFEFFKLRNPFSTQEQGCHTFGFEMHISNFVPGMHVYSIFVMITIAWVL
jgi:hypothetical protein